MRYTEYAGKLQKTFFNHSGCKAILAKVYMFYFISTLVIQAGFLEISFMQTLVCACICACVYALEAIITTHVNKA